METDPNKVLLRIIEKGEENRVAFKSELLHIKGAAMDDFQKAYQALKTITELTQKHHEEHKTDYTRLYLEQIDAPTKKTLDKSFQTYALQTLNLLHVIDDNTYKNKRLRSFFLHNETKDQFTTIAAYNTIEQYEYSITQKLIQLNCFMQGMPAPKMYAMHVYADHEKRFNLELFISTFKDYLPKKKFLGLF